ncbi:MAG: hypothetical protein SFX74_10805 [Fimbriimonadaceae bacterium]|nr:hypothetical protein [Fimbriimonadaceae bacterium]
MDRSRAFSLAATGSSALALLFSGALDQSGPSVPIPEPPERPELYTTTCERTMDRASKKFRDQAWRREFMFDRERMDGTLRTMYWGLAGFLIGAMLTIIPAAQFGRHATPWGIWIGAVSFAVAGVVASSGELEIRWIRAKLRSDATLQRDLVQVRADYAACIAIRNSPPYVPVRRRP